MKKIKPASKPKHIIFYLTCLFFCLTSVLGGANENDWLENIILLYLAAALLTLSLYRLMTSENIPAEAKNIVPFLLFILFLPLIHLVPFPEQIWRNFPFHDLAVRALSSAEVKHPSGPLSLAPCFTWISLFSLLPPFAIFLSTILFNHEEKMAIIRVILICGVTNAVFGLFQFSLNSNSAFYLYPGPLPGEAVGFFKNRNHFAALMYALLPFAAVITLNSLSLKFNSPRHNRIIADYISLCIGLSSIFIFIVAGIFAKSRAGVILLMVALAWISFLPNWKAINIWRNESRNKIYSKAYGLFVGFSIIFAMEYGFYRLMERFEADSLFGMRQAIATNTLNAAFKALPYGTGVGSFQKVYAAIQPIDNVIPHKFVNRAHNDFLELFLETGWLGLFVIIGFMLWYIYHLYDAWLNSNNSSFNLGIKRASCMTIGLLLLHSFVDYPLRTQVLMCIFALCCSFLIGSPPLNTFKLTPSEEVSTERESTHNQNQRRKNRSRTR